MHRILGVRWVGGHRSRAPVARLSGVDARGNPGRGVSQFGCGLGVIRIASPGGLIQPDRLGHAEVIKGEAAQEPQGAGRVGLPAMPGSSELTTRAPSIGHEEEI